MKPRTWVWLVTVAVIAVLVAYQTVSSASRRSHDFVAQAGLPTVAPGVDVLAGITVVPERTRRHDYHRSASRSNTGTA